MDIRKTIRSQYCAALEMLKLAIANCPDDLWDDKRYGNRFWHIAYHAIFYTHLYLQDIEQDFVPWIKHRDTYQFLGRITYPPYEEPAIVEPYTKEEIFDYFELCRKAVEERVSHMDIEADSGFHWLPFGKLELQFYSIRHIQHHAGQLIERLRNHGGIRVDWIVMMSEKPE